MLRAYKIGVAIRKSPNDEAIVDTDAFSMVALENRHFWATGAGVTHVDLRFVIRNGSE
jgi:hypothetical protein